MESSNNSSTIWYTHFPPLIRRTRASRITRPSFSRYSTTPTLPAFVKGLTLALFRALPLHPVANFLGLLGGALLPRLLRGFRTHGRLRPQSFPHSDDVDVLARFRCPFVSFNEITSHHSPKRAFPIPDTQDEYFDDVATGVIYNNGSQGCTVG